MESTPGDNLPLGTEPTSRARRKAGSVRWIIVAMLCAVGFVLYVDRVNISVAVPSMKQEFRFSEQMRGNILGAFIFGYAVGLVPGGWLADRFGPRRVLTVAAVLWGVLSILTALVRRHVEFFGFHPDPVATLIAVRFLLGICEACAFPTFNRALANWMRRSERALASGLIHSGSVLGGAFTQVFVAFITANVGWRSSFLMAGELSFAMALLWWLYATDRPEQHRKVTPQELAVIAAEKEEATRAEPPDGSWFRRMARSRSAWMLCASEVFYGLAGFVFTTWFYTYFVEVRKAGEITSGFLSSLNFLAMAIGAPAGGFLCDLCVRKWGSPWGRRTVPLVSITAAGCCLAVAPIIPNHAASAAVFAVAAGLFFTAASAFWSTLIDITRRGTGILGGLMNGSGQVGSALGTVSFPWLRGKLDSWEGALQVGGLMGVISGLIWLWIDSSRQIDDNKGRVS